MWNNQYAAHFVLREDTDAISHAVPSSWALGTACADQAAQPVEFATEHMQEISALSAWFCIDAATFRIAFGAASGQVRRVVPGEILGIAAAPS